MPSADKYPPKISARFTEKLILFYLPKYLPVPPRNKFLFLSAKISARFAEKKNSFFIRPKYPLYSPGHPMCLYLYFFFWLPLTVGIADVPPFRRHGQLCFVSGKPSFFFFFFSAETPARSAEK